MVPERYAFSTFVRPQRLSAHIFVEASFPSPTRNVHCLSYVLQVSLQILASFCSHSEWPVENVRVAVMRRAQRAPALPSNTERRHEGAREVAKLN